jgi:2-phosphosulfolactate phosphatase
MTINILHLNDGASAAKGLTVIIDVFRAFSVECYAFHNNAEKIIAVSEIDLAYELKKNNPDYILLGERNESIMPGFDFGNSPSHILNEDFTGKTLVHTTSSGTQGIARAIHADEIITGSFVNAAAIVNYIKVKKPKIVSLVCMGYATLYPVEEDSFCAEYIRNELSGIPSDFGQMKETIRNTSGKRFFEEGKQHFAPSSDFDLCLDRNRFDFIIRAEKKGDLAYMKRINL